MKKSQITYYLIVVVSNDLIHQDIVSLEEVITTIGHLASNETEIPYQVLGLISKVETWIGS